AAHPHVRRDQITVDEARAVKARDLGAERPEESPLAGAPSERTGQILSARITRDQQAGLSARRGDHHLGRAEAPGDELPTHPEGARGAPATGGRVALHE